MSLLENKSCLSETEILSYYEGSLPARKRPFVQEHLASCDDCRELLVMLNREEKTSDGGDIELPAEPGTDYIENQASRIIAMIKERQVEKALAARSSVKPSRGFFKLTLSRSLLAAASVIVIVIGGFIVFRSLHRASGASEGMAVLAQAVHAERRITPRISGGLAWSNPILTRGESGRDDQQFERAIDKVRDDVQDSSNIESRIVLARIYLSRSRGGDNEKALELLKDIPETTPRAGELLNDRGVALLESGRYSEAVAMFEAALKRNPGIEEAMFNLALGLERMGKTSESIVAWKRFLDSTSPEQGWKEEARSHIKYLSTE